MVGTRTPWTVRPSYRGLNVELDVERVPAAFKDIQAGLHVKFIACLRRKAEFPNALSENDQRSVQMPAAALGKCLSAFWTMSF